MSEIICYRCGGKTPLDTATGFWNLRLPISDSEDEKTLYDICPSCYRRVLDFIESEHNKRLES